MKLKLLISAALLGLADAVRGQRLATNAEPATSMAAPAITVGLPSDVDPERVRQRKIALITAGTNSLLAEKLAIDAEQQQRLRDLHLKAVAEVKEVPVTTEVLEVHAEPDADKKTKAKK